MEKQALALFDFDGTLIKGDTIVRYVRLAKQQGKMTMREFVYTLWRVLLCALGFISDEEAKTSALKFWARMPQKERAAFDEAFALSLTPLLYKKGRERLARCAQEGKKVLLVSASTENYMQYVARALHVDGLLCTRVNEQGVVRDNCKGKEKLKRIDAWLEENGWVCDRKSTVAFGDSGSDFDMLSAYGTGVQVNPKRALKKKTHGNMALERW